MTENKALQKAIDEYKENLRQEKLRLELSNYSAPLRKTIEENIRDIELEIKWLEEIQQYRAIGTIEEIQSMKDQLLMVRDMCKDYYAIGTMEDFKSLKEKAEPKKPILNNPKINKFYVKEAELCPVCHSYINSCSGDYCRDCGQHIDWSE